MTENTSTTDTLTIDAVTAASFADAFASRDFAHEVAPSMTCIESEAVAAMLRAIGAEDAAAQWDKFHAAQDEEGDSHYQAADYIVPVDPMDELNCDSCQ